MQLVNTSSAGNIRVYYDPWAGETASFASGGIKVAGGIDKSYYVKVGDVAAVYMNKSEYKKNGADLYGDCNEAIEAYNKDSKWKYFAAHVQVYFDNCNE